MASDSKRAILPARATQDVADILTWVPPAPRDQAALPRGSGKKKPGRAVWPIPVRCDG